MCLVDWSRGRIHDIVYRSIQDINSDADCSFVLFILYVRSAEVPVSYSSEGRQTLTTTTTFKALPATQGLGLNPASSDTGAEGLGAFDGWTCMGVRTLQGILANVIAVGHHVYGGSAVEGTAPRPSVKGMQTDPAPPGGSAPLQRAAWVVC